MLPIFYVKDTILLIKVIIFFMKIGINQEPKIFKVNTTNHKDYREYYNDRTAMIVYEKFKDEIEYLGYEYDH